MKKRAFALILIFALMMSTNALAAGLFSDLFGWAEQEMSEEGFAAKVNGKSMTFEVSEVKDDGAFVTVCFDIVDNRHEEVRHRFVMMMDRYVEPMTYEIRGEDGRMTLWYYDKPRYGRFSEKYQARYAVKPSPVVNLGKALSKTVGDYTVHFDSVEPFCSGTVNAVLEQNDGSCVEINGRFGFCWP